MLKEMMMLVSYGGFSGGQFGKILSQWEQMGVFSYMLPFLIIFAIIFGILSKIKLFGDEHNKAINAIIALSTSLISLQFGVVSVFFSEIFPKMGAVMGGVLVVLIVLGLFIDPKKPALLNALMWVAFAVVGIVIVTSLDVFSWSNSTLLGFISPIWWDQWGPLVILLILVAVVVGASVKRDPKNESILQKAISAASQ